jgi:DNA-binding CsgD family transcriptional regulator
MSLMDRDTLGPKPCTRVGVAELVQDRPDADVLSGARRWAVNEVGAAIAHQLVEPMTALLLYMHDLKSLMDPSLETAPVGAWKAVEGAVRETERICDMLERIGSRFEGPLDPESAVKSGREAITWWSRTGSSELPATAKRTHHHRLTPREREVLDEISGGATNKEGAQRLGISPRTFEAHRAEIMRKLGARNAADLLRKVLLEAQ